MNAAEAAADVRRNLVTVPPSFAATFAKEYLRGSVSLDALAKRLGVELRLLPKGFPETDGWFLDGKRRVLYMPHGTKRSAMRRALLEAAVRFAAHHELGGKGLAYIDHRSANAVARSVARLHLRGAA